MRPVLPCFVVCVLTGCSGSPEDTISRIDRLVAEGKLGDAELLCRKLLVNKQLPAEANRRLARIAMRQGRLPAAFSHIRESLAVNPRDEESWNFAGELLLPAYWGHPSRHGGIRDQLETAGSTLLRLNADSVTGNRIEGYLALDSGRAAAAERFFQKVLALRPADEQAAAMLIQVLFTLDRNGEAIALANRALDLHEGSALIRTALYRGLMQKGRTQEAGELLLREAGRASADINVRLDLAIHYRRTGAVARSEAMIAETEARAATIAGGRMTIAAFHQRSGDYERAISALRDGERTEPERAAEYLRALAGVQFEISDLAGARESARRGAARYPGNEDFQVRQHLLEAELGGAGELEAAVRYIRSLVEKHPGSAVYRMHLGRLLLASGNNAGANKELARAIQLEPGLLEARLLSIRGHVEAGRYEQVLAEAEAALQIDSNLLPAVAAKLSALRALGRFAEARVVLRELRESGADPAAATLEEAYILLMEGKPRPAEALLRGIPPARRTGLRAVAAMAEALTAQGKWAEAVSFLRDDLRQRPGRPLVSFALAKSLAGAGQPDIAKAHFEEMLQSHPGSSEAMQALAELEVSRGDEKAAEAAYRRWIGARPENEVALNDLAYLLAQKGTNLGEAMTLAQRALALSPGNPGVLDTIGVLHLKMGHPTEAARIFSSLSRQVPEVPAVRFHAGQSLHARGEREAALREWAAALRLRPAPQLRREIESAIASAARP